MKPFLLVLAMLMAFPTSGRAEDLTERTNRIVLGVGTYNVLDDDDNQRQSDFRLELRLGKIPVWKLHPWLGFDFISHGVSWAGGGLETDIDLWRGQLLLTLQTGVGYFNDGIGSGYNGSPGSGTLFDNPESGIQFRHQAELAWQFEAGNRLGIGITHMSNANIEDKGNHNIQTLMLNAQIPLNFTPGRVSAPQ